MRWIGQRALATYADELERRCLMVTTRDRYTATVRTFLLAVGKPAARVVRQDVRAWLAARALRGIRSTPAELDVLRDFFSLLHEEGRIPRDPTAKLPRLDRAPRRAQLLLGPDDVRSLLAEALVEPPVRRLPPVPQALALRTRACLELLYGLGLRASEVCVALVADLDLVEGSLLCRAAKRGPERRLPLPPASLPHLERYLREGRPVLLHARGGDEGRLLLNQRGRPMNGNGVLKLVHEVAQRASVRATPHAFRRSVATHLVRAGVSVPAVQKLLGHSSLGITARYVLIDIEDLHRAVAVLELDGGVRKHTEAEAAVGLPAPCASPGPPPRR